MEGFVNPLLIRALWRISALIPFTSHTLKSAGGYWALGSLMLFANDLKGPLCEPTLILHYSEVSNSFRKMLVVLKVFRVWMNLQKTHTSKGFKVQTSLKKSSEKWWWKFSVQQCRWMVFFFLVNTAVYSDCACITNTDLDHRERTV